ncbi:dioxygenase family protein [Roseivivax sediminis]|uniref:Protocatechuate 3,4-dioxygenase beta subunit n=1 Tax=Roseivivax sediminis TaxID=936889 RepID=A0A1I1T3N3_9RHOB|nr:dioxygenase [Roseivivax sediminis]SFD53254.1 Protocatechuate 3,4-dioxygenase beta subunit [Roseivivax sediminis]
MMSRSESLERMPAAADPGVTAEIAERLVALPRSRLVTALGQGIVGLHRIIADIRLSGDELLAIVAFLTEVGHHVDRRRQEWVLLADLLGVSTLVHDLSNARPAGATPNTIPGPFYREDVPEMLAGSNISRDGKGEPLEVSGRIQALGGRPVAGAGVEVWHANDQGVYENQDPHLQPEFNLRGRFRTDAQGRFRFLTVKPAGYALPSDGPAGRLMIALGLPPVRPAHLHFRVCRKGYETLTTHVFDRADPAVDRDAVFGVKPELLAEFRALPPRGGRPCHALDLEFVLCPARAGDTEPNGRK